MRSNAGMANRQEDVDLSSVQVSTPQLEIWFVLEMDCLFTAIQSVWRISEQVAWTAESERDLADELPSVKRVKRISEVLFSRPVSVL